MFTSRRSQVSATWSKYWRSPEWPRWERYGREKVGAGSNRMHGSTSSVMASKSRSENASNRRLTTATLSGPVSRLGRPDSPEFGLKDVPPVAGRGRASPWPECGRRLQPGPDRGGRNQHNGYCESPQRGVERGREALGGQLHLAAVGQRLGSAHVKGAAAQLLNGRAQPT